MMNTIRFVIGRHLPVTNNMKQLKYLSTKAASQPLSESVTAPKTAILMLNMGGPKTTDEVHDYLLRIMTDRDMIQLPVQGTLGPYIAKRRTPEVQKKYTEIGGGSPILKWTDLQGNLLCKKLDRVSPETAPHKHYIAFRYANPLTEETLEKIENDQVERVVIFSQYPQYSCATTGSSFNAIYKYFKGRPLRKGCQWSVIDRWPTHPLLVKTVAERIRTELREFSPDEQKNVMILFSAHSLPLKAVNRGDPYPSEVGATVQAVMNELSYCNPFNLVWQSKVGPLPWLAPFTDDALKGYVKQGRKNFILVPIAFVNEHIETLHEMDIEYCKDLGKELGNVTIRRAAAPNDHPLFIEALADIVLTHLKRGQTVSPKFLTRCPHCVNINCEKTKSWFQEICNNY
ncbi:ferrochelatase, mitochondrial [Schistocerca americana]|uniref:ferrochelatase, mitochondrial n=1 Tax=Schistocerca americana TaxID=7009 RepID=UPI001F4FB80B|nr:ferrochelatase, mitochondrial [Schistocerca americana]XP_049960719.1 ferrochelatase, mitochondrial isoform X2 [Schistocerca serialis cubense]XP_049960720.1 ferrochelatase, mitochondrial isoform X2 [Schistocerca serialis cubense]